MDNTVSLITFIIVSFCLALVLIIKKDTIPPQFRRGLAILSLVMVSCSFVLIVYSLITLG